MQICRPNPGVCQVQRAALASLCLSLLMVVTACNVGQKTTTLSLDTTPTTVQATAQFVFSASISHNNGQFLGATWTLTTGGAACTAACGTLSNYTNTGSQGNGDTTTITYTAPNAMPTPNSITITATSKENSGASQSDTFTISSAGPLAITTASVPATGTVGTPYPSTTLSASGGAPPYTWSQVSGTLPSGLSFSSGGTISGTPAAAALFNFTVQVTDSAQGNSTAQYSISVTTTNSSACGAPGGKEALLNGQYAMLLEGIDSSGYANVVAGTFTADGAGNLTGGEQDSNLHANANESNTTINSANQAYTVGADNRGCLAITTGDGNAFVYRFVLSSVNGGIASRGKLVEFDNVGYSTGVMTRQDSAAFSTAAIQGNYAFGVMSPLQGEFAAVGSFTASNGTISSGALDANVGGSNIDYSGNTTYPVSSVAFTGTDTVDANGRTTLNFTTGANQLNATCYVVSAGELDCISSDSQATAPVFLGTVVQQSGGPFSNASLNGPYVRYLTGAATAGVASGVKVELGLVQADGNGNFSQTADANDGGSIQTGLTASGNYSVAANGRIVIPKNEAPVLYMVSPSEVFAMGTSPNVSFGLMELQSGGPFSNSSLSGTYSFSQWAPTASPSELETGILKSDGAGNISSYVDDAILYGGGLYPGVQATATYSLGTDGRGTLTLTSNGNSVTEVLYMVSPSKWVRIPVNSGNSYPGLIVSEQ